MKKIISQNLLSNLYKSLFKKEKNKQVIILIIGSILLILASMVLFFWSEHKSATKEGRKPRTIREMLGFVDAYTLKEILVGMSSSFVFGFIDNGGLFFGMDTLDPFLPGGQLTKAGYGNTYSDALGSLLGSFIGGTIENLTGLEKSPLWAESFGLVCGCLVGIFIPRLITGKS